MFLMLLCAVLAVEEPAGGEPSSSEQIRFYETSIRPLLIEHCLKCHGEKKQWGGLRLDSREATLRGGDTGAAIVPGKPLESLLIQAVQQEDEDLRMPKGDKLNERQIADLVRWIEMVRRSRGRQRRPHGLAIRIIGRFSRRQKRPFPKCEMSAGRSRH